MSSGPLALGDSNGVKGVTIDAGMLSMLWKAFNTDATIWGCRLAIQGSLLAGGVAFINTEKGLATNEEFHKLVQKAYMRFCVDAIDALLVQGFVPYVLHRDTQTKLLYPSVVPAAAGLGYKISIKSDYSTEIVATKAKTSGGGVSLGETRDRRVLFAVMDAPYPDGQLRSRVAAAFRGKTVTDTFERNALTADAIRANPPVLCATKTDHAFDERDLVNVNGVDGLRAHGQEQVMLLRNRINMSTFSQQAKLVDALTTGRIDTGAESWTRTLDPMTGLPRFLTESDDGSYRPNLVPLPNDVSPASFTLPTTRTDLVQIRGQAIETICTAMGVPYSTIAHARSGGEAARDTIMLKQSVGFIRNVLSDVLLSVFAANVKDNEGTAVVFPSLQNSHAMENLFKSGVLTYEAYLQFCNRYYGVPVGYLSKEDPRTNGAAPGGAAGGAPRAKPPVQRSDDPTSERAKIDEAPAPKRRKKGDTTTDPMQRAVDRKETDADGTAAIAGK